MTQSTAPGPIPDGAARAPHPVLVIRPPRGIASLNLREVIQYREIISTFALREIKLRYRQTALGVVWVVLQPLMMAGISSFVFGQVAGMGKGDPAFFAKAFAGQIAWGIFGLTIFKISTSLVGNSAMLSKVFFPRLTLPLASVAAAQMDFLIGLALLLLLMPFLHIAPTMALLTLPFWFALLAAMSLGFGMMTAALMVSYRDVGFVLPVLLNSLMAFSPVAWPLAKMSEHIPPQWHPLYFLLNPVAALIEGMRWALCGNPYPVPGPWLAYSAAMAALILWLGALIFRHEERRFADVI